MELQKDDSFHLRCNIFLFTVEILLKLETLESQYLKILSINFTLLLRQKEIEKEKDIDRLGFISRL